MGGSRSKKPVRGQALCDDEELQKLLQDWASYGVSFTGMMLLAEGKEANTTYDMEEDSWTVTEVIRGVAGIVLKSTGDGWLYVRLTAVGFHWEHASGSFRRLLQADPSGLRLKLVDSSTRKFEVVDVQQ